MFFELVSINSRQTLSRPGPP